ncbi:MAG: adenosylmethionine--8-amino-7-oxononanoate transaminase [Burkholderiales bacterium]
MNNRELGSRSRQALWHPCTQMKFLETMPLVPIQRGRGVWLYDYEGKRYLDGISSWWVNLFGHGNPRIKAAIADQLEKIEHVMLAGFTHEPAILLAEKLSSRTGNKLGHCFFASDGASATEIALKMSFHYWRNAGLPQKNTFVSLQNSYHGETLGALSVTDVAIFKDAYAPLMRCSAVVPSPDFRLAASGESAREYALRCAASLEHHFADHHASIAALIVEPLVQGAAGMAMYDAAYLARARELCDQHQIHLIADEIAVGFGRTGTFFAYEQANITPDFLCLSKGITGGYLPLSVVLTSDIIFAAFYSDDVSRGFLHSHSYTGNALACCAALATLEIFDQENILQSNRQKQKYINTLCEEFKNYQYIQYLRNVGMIWAFDVKTDNKKFTREFYAEALKNELLVRPIGNVVYFMPPYVINDDDAKFLLNGTIKTLTTVMQK